MKGYIAAPLLTLVLGLALNLLKECLPTPPADIGWERLWSEDVADKQSMLDVERDLDMVKRQRAERQAVIDDLRGQRITLFEAAVRFRETTRGAGPSPQLFQGRSEMERLCRQVIFWTAHDDPQFARQLETELEETLQEGSLFAESAT